MSSDVQSRPILGVQDIVLERISLAARESYSDKEEITGELTRQFGVEFADDTRLFRIQLSVDVENAAKEVPGNTPYEIHASLRGTFHSPAPLMRELPASLANNALAILYGSLRATVLHLTGVSTNGPLCLPAMSFDSIVTHAAHKDGTGVVSDNQGAANTPAAEGFFRFRFAIEDLGTALPAMSVDTRSSIEPLLEALTSTMNRMAEERGIDFQILLEIARAMAAASSTDTSAIAPLLAGWTQAIVIALELMAENAKRLSPTKNPGLPNENR